MNESVALQDVALRLVAQLRRMGVDLRQHKLGAIQIVRMHHRAFMGTLGDLIATKEAVERGMTITEGMSESQILSILRA